MRWWLGGRRRGEVVWCGGVEEEDEREAEGLGAGEAAEAGGEEVGFGVCGWGVVSGEEGGEEGGGVGYEDEGRGGWFGWGGGGEGAEVEGR